MARHLSDSYGDRAWTVCEYAEPTGERWPLHGKRLNRLYPYIEAEVRYAVHNEYALTAVDFLARRSRLTFLNSNAALDALPRVVEIMGDELGWSKWRKNKEIRDAEIFMESMGVPFGTRRYRIGWREWAKEQVNWMLGAKDDGSIIAGAVKQAAKISRAQFEPGELDRLKGSFSKRVPTTSAAPVEHKYLSTEEVRTLAEEKLNLAWLTEAEVERVIMEVTQGRKIVDQEEFIHVSDLLSRFLSC